MNKITLLKFFPVALAGLLLLRLLSDWPLFPTPNFEQYTHNFLTVTLCLALLLLGLTFIKSKLDFAPNSAWLLTASALIVLGGAAGLTLYANPDGVYPWNKHPVYVIGGVRSIKLNLYQEIASPPKIVVLGSSHAHVLNGAAFAKDSFFNWSVEGGDMIDALTIEKYVLQNQTPKPSLLIIEVSPYLLHNWSNRTPLALAPYLKPEMLAEYLSSQLTNLLSLNSIAKDTFTIEKIILTSAEGHFFKNGVMKVPPVTEQQYWNTIQQQTPAQVAKIKCAGVPPEEQTFLQAIVHLAQQNKIGLVFYVSPINADLLDQIDLNDSAIESCTKKMDTYLLGLTQDHPGAYYKNLLFYAPISNLRRTGYFDEEHLTEIGAQAVINTLAPEIQSALTWAAQTQQP